MNEFQRGVARAQAQNQQHQAWASAQERPPERILTDEELAAQHARQAAEREREARRLARLKAIEDPVERLLVMLSRVTLNANRIPFVDLRPGVAVEEMAQLCPGLISTYGHLDGTRITRWFVDRARATGLEDRRATRHLPTGRKKLISGARKTSEVEGWVLHNAFLQMHRDNRKPLDGFVSPDATVWPIVEPKPVCWYSKDLTAAGAQDMARALRLG